MKYILGTTAKIAISIHLLIGSDIKSKDFSFTIFKGLKNWTVLKKSLPTGFIKTAKTKKNRIGFGIKFNF
jgi:hypothetical protein